MSTTTNTTAKSLTSKDEGKEFRVSAPGFPAGQNTGTYRGRIGGFAAFDGPTGRVFVGLDAKVAQA